MGKKFVVSAADVIIRDVNTKELIAVGRTLMDSSLKEAIKSKEVRGGYGNGLQYEWSYEKTLELNLTDCAFKEAYIAMNNGTKIHRGLQEYFINGEIVQIHEGKGKLAKIPYSKKVFVEYEDDSTEMVEVKNQEITLSKLQEGQVAVTYRIQGELDYITIDADKYPTVYDITLIAKKDEVGVGMGEVQIHIPQFKPKGDFTLDLKADSVVAPKMSGKALSASGTKRYATFKFIDPENKQIQFENIAIMENELNLKVGESVELPQVIGIRGALYDNIPLDLNSLNVIPKDTKVVKFEKGKLVYVGTGSTQVTIELNTDKTKSDTIEVSCEDSKAVVKKLTV